ncbi:hypothetical protein EDB89DRAFT_1183784 [Lactarius sanguifluus]|nr:hypothetical protein EDB89DRAFT_1183784 [Lactarius sanguifluus]
MLNNSHIYHQTLHDIKKRGIDVKGVKLNLQQMLKAKGTASFVSPKLVPVQLNDGGESTVEAKNVIIATGSEVAPFPVALSR